MDNIVNVISSVGFPIAMALLLFWYMTNVIHKITLVGIKLDTCEFKFFSFHILEQIDIFISLVFSNIWLCLFCFQPSHLGLEFVTLLGHFT